MTSAKWRLFRLGPNEIPFHVCQGIATCLKIGYPQMKSANAQSLTGYNENELQWLSNKYQISSYQFGSLSNHHQGDVPYSVPHVLFYHIFFTIQGRHAKEK